MKRLLLSALVFPLPLFAQPIELDMDVFGARRDQFMQALEPGGTAIFPCKPEYQRNLDVEYEYRQESNFYYLSGFEEPESILLLNPAAPRYRFVMFVRNRDPRTETYDGPRAGVEGAMSVFRADTALLYADFEKAVYRYMSFAGPLYYTFGINPRLDEIMRTICIDRRSGINCPLIDPAPILAGMRLIKNDGDWKNGLRKAIDISALGHRAAMKAIRPGKYEMEIQAVFESTFRTAGSPRNGYPCIVGSGPNSGILHYSRNTRKMLDGEVILMDCGAEYGYYSADITRTVPVNGRFSQEQRAIYQIVLDAQQAAMDLVRPGATFSTLDSAINRVIGNGLKSLGLIRDTKDARMYTLHGYCHWIGLEVHDVGGYTEGGKPMTFRPGMVFTIEPGIYVRSDIPDKMKERGYSDEEVSEFRRSMEPYMNIGVRIEDDILVTESGMENLSTAAPRSIEDIEELMNQ
jgi:Xaa-Pro aminopeptidase